MRNKIFEKVPQVVPRRSGFDLSHENRGTGKPGILIPVMTREMEGHDSLSVNLGAQIQFPPFATDFYGRVKVYFEAFFVPYRIIDGNYKNLYRYSLYGANTGGSSPSLATIQQNMYFEGLDVFDLSPTGTIAGPNSTTLPQLTSTMTADPSVGLIGPGTLLDYLGVKTGKIITASGATAKPLRLKNYHRLTAYHRIYEEYYNDSRIQQHAFVEYHSGSLNNAQMLQTVPYRGTPYNSGNKYILTDDALKDGCYLTGLRSRNYAKDYFTTATPDPQFGNEMKVTPDSSGNISISQIRAASALQQYFEIYNRVGLHYDDLAFALTGIRPSDAAVDIPVYLGRQIYDVYCKSVYSTDDTRTGTIYPGNANPFGGVGSKFANAQALGSGHICDFTATEGGIFMILMSVAPDASYDSGSARQWDYDTIFDLPKPQLAGIGDQPIYKGEIINDNVALSGVNTHFVTHDHSDIFGYVQRFSEAKFMLDETHGMLREYQSLSAFALKRHFDYSSDAQLGSAFLKVPVNCLAEVTTTPSATSGINLFYWFDIYFDVKLVSNLPAYSLPTLENMDGPVVMVNNGGRRL